MDSSCLPALLDVASPALPRELLGRLIRWDELPDGERQRARGDLEALAALMRTPQVTNWSRSFAS